MRGGVAPNKNGLYYNHTFSCLADRRYFPPLGMRLQSTNFSSSKEQIQNSQRLDSHFQRTNGRKPLPLPPVLNPLIVAAQKRYRQPKAESSGQNWTEFQQRLYRNPYGKSFLLNMSGASHY